MAKVLIILPDETYEKYAKHTPQSPQTGIERQLERFKDYSPSERALLFRPAERQALEKVFGNPIEDQKKFVAFVEGLMSVEIGDVKVTLSPEQIKRVAGEAKFFGREVNEFLKDKLERLVRGAF
jgi:hypothetical protein